LSFRPNAELEAFRRQVEEGRNPMEIKFELALEITARFAGAAAARQARENFAALSQRREVPQDVQDLKLTITGTNIGITALLKQANLAASTSAASRLIEQGGVRLNGEKVSNPRAEVSSGHTYLFQVGKRTFAQIEVVSGEAAR
jgi:tyrosyl-tRNA synthetase